MVDAEVNEIWNSHSERSANSLNFYFICHIKIKFSLEYIFFFRHFQTKIPDSEQLHFGLLMHCLSN